MRIFFQGLSLVILTSRFQAIRGLFWDGPRNCFEATPGLFWDGPRNFERRGRYLMTRMTPDPAPPSPNFHATPTGGPLVATYDLACSRPHTRQIFSGIGLRTRNPLAPKPRPYH
ncbi:hypothetical protein AVEN_159783-1 [Araneus ventricosus]|uniref:Secreted protein n=1 Tax=Araneus ventricosus TaxID=182803 RepID=A0A4Y2DCT6_ARAVE|nr:hypothetical protein AVEN_159783-1 [Araneus ventricosus]